NPPPHRYVPPPSERPDRDEPPDARTGFQIALRTGVSVPAGSVSGAANTSMSTWFKAQIPLFVELGFKLTPNLFLRWFGPLGVGPWAALDLGQYSHFHNELAGVAADGSISSTALHEWLSLGVRVVFFP